MGPIGMIANTALETGMGMVTGAINDARQLKQQGRLLEQQYDIDGRALARSKEAELQQWKDTSYATQVAEMKKGNLSPGLMYGGGGGGGATVGGSGQTVNAAKAPTGGREIMDMQMNMAQRKLIEAQTKQIETQTAKTAGVDTDLTKWQARQAMNASQFFVDTYEQNFDKVLAEAEILKNQSKTSNETQKMEVEAKKAELIGLAMANELKKAQTDLTEEQMKATAEAVKQKWQEVNIKQGQLDLDKFIKDVKESTKLTTESIIRVIG